jgi:hypothetical protein
MRTSNMIYQAAIAHQVDLRRTASKRSLKADRNSSPSAWNRLFALVTSRQQRARAATTLALTGSAIRHISI